MRRLSSLFALAAFGAATAAAQTTGDAAKGQTIATQVCAACHGVDGNSAIAANPNLAGQFPEYLQKQLSDFKAAPGHAALRNNPVMSAMVANLSPEDIRNVAAYYAQQKPMDGAARDKETIALGQRIWRAGDASKGLPACAACHGPTGAGIPAQFPRLAGQHQEYLVAQLLAFRSGTRANDPNKMMQAIASRMTDAEMRAVADYAAGLHSAGAR